VEHHGAKLKKDEEYIMNLALGYQSAQVLFAAVNMNIFTIIDGGKKEISEIAEIAGSDEQSLGRLLNTLVALNLLKKDEGRYVNLTSASRYLVRGEKTYLGNAIHHSNNLWDFWQGLDEQVKCGYGRDLDEEKIEDYSHRLQDYLAAMHDFATIKADMLADAIMIDTHKKMLDLGCGPGTYAIAATNKAIDIELFKAYILTRGQNLIAGELTALEDLPGVVPVQEPVILTDDYVPVDNMLAPLFSTR